MNDELKQHQPRSAASRQGVNLSCGVFACAAILVAVLALSSVRADDGKSGPKSANPKAATVPEPSATFDLRIVGPDDKPLSDASVNVRSVPPLDKGCVKAGTFVTKSRFGIYIRSGAEGRVAFERPSPCESLNLTIRKSGYATYMASWRGAADPIPATLTATLQTGWTIGGILVDGSGKPVPNARVRLTIYFTGPGRPRGLLSQSTESAFANDQGIWKYDGVPRSMSSVVAEINQPSFPVFRTLLSRTQFAIEPGHEPSAKITLNAGLTVNGKVTDQNGSPIAKALVRTRFEMQVRTAWTGTDGVYRLEGCAPGLNRIVACAKHHAPGLQEVDLAEGAATPPVDFQLKPGNTIRMRVLDKQGRPIPKARVIVERGHSSLPYTALDQAPHETDGDGVWEWNEAPPDELQVDVEPPDGMMVKRPIVARKEEYIFRLPSVLVISGNVFDAETKQPIKKFRVVSRVSQGGEELGWANKNIVSNEGRFQIRKTVEEPGYLMRVVADGYHSAAAREIKSDEENVTVDFGLVKGRSVAATVLTPDGTPAAGAKVALLSAGKQFLVQQGELQNGKETDQSGKFRLEIADDDFWIVITHPSGCAELPGQPATDPRVIKLMPWSRLEGVFPAARKPEGAIELSATLPVFLGENRARITVKSVQPIDGRGRFVFERVLPGSYQVLAKWANGAGDSEMTSSIKAHALCLPGDIGRIDLATDGRPVSGQVRVLDSKSGIQLSSVQISVQYDPSEMRPDAPREFAATPDHDGNFFIEGVPPGNYYLNAWVPQQLGARSVLHRFVVPRINKKLSQRPVELGVLTLTMPAAGRGRRAARAPVRR
jgi:Carboxypeptidase regulatory-like domain